MGGKGKKDNELLKLRRGTNARQQPHGSFLNGNVQSTYSFFHSIFLLSFLFVPAYKTLFLKDPHTSIVGEFSRSELNTKQEIYLALPFLVHASLILQTKLVCTLCPDTSFLKFLIHFRHFPMKTPLSKLTQSVHLCREALHRALEGI
jgi:hypothetical protein